MLRISPPALAMLTSMFVLGIAPAVAETRAVVVGIDNYKYINRLKGAENDARDITATLTSRGVKDLAALNSSTATRASVLKALDDVIGRTKAGDLVVISFAGHGATERWGAVRPADVQLGDQYTVFLMPDFEPPAANGRPPQRGSFNERILGREMNARLTQLDRKGARTVFIADTCHGGGMTRSIPREVASTMTFRFQEDYPPPESDEDVVQKEAAKVGGGDFEHLKSLPNVTFLAAVDKSKKAPELPIPPASTTMRGALSYAFARAIEGEADTNRDGKLTRDELFYYLRSNVRQISDRVQEPELQPLRTEEVVAIDLTRDFAGAPAVATQVAPSRRVRIFVEGAGGALPARSRSGELELALASTRADADLVWTPATQQVSTAGGDLVAETVSRSAIDAIAEREVLRRELSALARARPLQITLDGGDGMRRQGDMVVARAVVPPQCEKGGTRCPPLNYVVFNVAGDGTLQYLFPKNDEIHPKFKGTNEPLTLDPTSPLLRMRVMPPYGTDTLVMVTSSNSLVSLAGAIASMDQRTEPLDVVSAIKRFLPEDATIATQPIFTRP